MAKFGDGGYELYYIDENNIPGGSVGPSELSLDMLCKHSKVGRREHLFLFFLSFTWSQFEKL